jgi:hypothetical protein
MKSGSGFAWFKGNGMLFNVTKAVNFILDDEKDRYSRAIKLFQLHVGIRLANGFPEKRKLATSEENSSPSDLVVRVSKKKMQDARMFATMKLMEHVEKQLKEGIGVVSAKHLAKNPDWTKLFDKFLRFGGFHRARYLSAAINFDIELGEAGQKAKKLAQAIDFSLRFEPDPQGRKTKKTGGITMAKAIVADSKYFNVTCCERTLESYWEKFEPVAAFLPLISLKKYPAWPLHVSKTKFADKLLSRLDDKDMLMSFFAEYNANVLRLDARGYGLKSLVGLPTADVVFDALPEEVKALTC